MQGQNRSNTNFDTTSSNRLNFSNNIAFIANVVPIFCWKLIIDPQLCEFFVAIKTLIDTLIMQLRNSVCTFVPFNQLNFVQIAWVEIRWKNVSSAYEIIHFRNCLVLFLVVVFFFLPILYSRVTQKSTIINWLHRFWCCAAFSKIHWIAAVFLLVFEIYWIVCLYLIRLTLGYSSIKIVVNSMAFKIVAKHAVSAIVFESKQRTNHAHCLFVDLLSH